MKIKRVSETVIDVFFETGDAEQDKGWKNWCRFEIVHEGPNKKLRKLKGMSVPTSVFHFLSRRYGSHK